MNDNESVAGAGRGRWWGVPIVLLIALIMAKSFEPPGPSLNVYVFLFISVPLVWIYWRYFHWLKVIYEIFGAPRQRAVLEALAQAVLDPGAKVSDFWYCRLTGTFMGYPVILIELPQKQGPDHMVVFLECAVRQNLRISPKYFNKDDNPAPVMKLTGFSKLLAVAQPTLGQLLFDNKPLELWNKRGLILMRRKALGSATPARMRHVLKTLVDFAQRCA